MYEIAEKYGTFFTNDMSRFRGRLLEETTYDTSGNVVLHKTNTYNLDDATKKYSISLKSSPRSFGYYKIYLTPCLLVQQDITDVNNVQEQILYSFNSFYFLRSKVTKNSTGKEYMVRYKYIGDYNLNIPTQNLGLPDFRTILDMKLTNMTGCLAEEQFLTKEQGNWILLKGKLIRYSNRSELCKPWEEYLLETSVPLTDVLESRLWPPGFLQFNDSYKKRIVYNDYDTYGNPLQIHSNDNVPISYVWSYASQYPVLEIQNATYEQAENAAPADKKYLFKIFDGGTAQTPLLTQNQLYPSNEEIWELAETLRTNLPYAQITAFTYKPLVGLTSVTDMNGIKTFYDYDTSGRLNNIEDNTHKTLTKYQYKYAGEMPQITSHTVNGTRITITYEGCFSPASAATISYSMLGGGPSANSTNGCTGTASITVPYTNKTYVITIKLHHPVLNLENSIQVFVP